MLFLKDMTKSYVDCLLRISVRRYELRKLNGGTLDFWQSFYLNNFRKSIEATIGEKDRKHRRVELELDPIKALKFHELSKILQKEMATMEASLLSLYKQLTMPKVKMSVIENRAVFLVAKRKVVESLMKTLFNRFKYNKGLLTLNIYYKLNLVFDRERINEQIEALRLASKLDTNKAFVDKYLNLIGDNANLLLKVESDKVAINQVDHNAIALFEADTREELVRHNVKEFMPENIAARHDGFIVAAV